MAIVFEKQLSFTNLLFSYNNNTVTFKPSGTIKPTKATVFFNNMQFTLFPDPQDKFYFNFKYAVSTMLNGTNNFADVINLDLVTPIAEAFKTRVIADGGAFEAYDCLIAQITELGVDPIIDYTDTIFGYYNVTYKIYYTDNTIDTEIIPYNFLSAVVNPQNYKQLYPGFPFDSEGQMFLKPIPYLKYWSGYPFDVTFYNGELSDLEAGVATDLGAVYNVDLGWEFPNSGGFDTFATTDGNFSGALNSNKTFNYESGGFEQVFDNLKIGDYITINDWKFEILNVTSVGVDYTITTKIIIKGTDFTPYGSERLVSAFELNSGIQTTETYTNENRINRVVISNGNELINLERGYNNFVINNVSIQIENITEVCGGHYLKWLNAFGGWNYWLFYKGNDTLTTKDLGTIYNDYEDVVDTISPYVAIGKTSENNIVVQQELITPNEMLILNDLLESPKVYLFTGTPNEVAQPNDWLEVTIKAGSFRVVNSREKLNSLSLTIELPMNNTKTL